ncbi:MAG: (d)CMP kinase [Proteobacteria bacterium]|nr:(d)CMP kinase [Pseudomonadota bacterium]
MSGTADAGGRPLVIAVDGPAAAGKGTLARRLARHLGLAHLDTGRLYRAVALKLIAAGGGAADEATAARAAAGLVAEDLEDPRLREEEVGQLASRVAAMPGVRAALLAFQRRFAAAPPGGARGAVLDGRDIGTAVCPDAAFKFFVTASLEARAGRRLKELAEGGASADRGAVLADMAKRDRRDEARAHAPLKPAEDAIVLDTTELDADAVFARVLALVEGRGGAGPRRPRGA